MDRLGDYRLRERLAVGGMGEVHLGEKVGPEGFVKPVVLKCVLPALAKDPGFVELFHDEARLAALLHHPNIAQVYDFGREGDVHFIAMEYVPGHTVNAVRRKLEHIGEPMPLEHVANIASQACAGLHYAHTLVDASGRGLGLVHRDVSPQNLIVSLDGTVKLVDFGIAKARQGLTRMQARGAVGKHGYMSPEQAMDAAVDGRSDLFSLGICMWELAANRKLHPHGMESAPNYARSPVPPLESVRDDVPIQFSRILDRALAVDPRDRFSNARAMHIELERFQAAMTHYAGAAALGEYVQSLLASPERGPNAAADAHALDGPRRYEEVFGVPKARPRTRSTPKLRAVPATWEERPAAGRSTQLIDLGEDSGPSLSLDTGAAQTRPASPPIPAPQSPPRRVLSTRTVFLACGLTLVAGGLAAIASGWIPLGTPSEPPATLTSACRFESSVDGATLSLDGEFIGELPREVELIPDVAYLAEVSAPGRATARQVVEGEILGAPRVIRLDLLPAASLSIVTKPPGAMVSLDGHPVDKRTPVTLDDVPSGRPVRVRVERAGSLAALATVELEEGAHERLELELLSIE